MSKGGRVRDDVLMQLVDRAMSDAEFRERARRDPETTLRDNGFDLTDEELAAVIEFQRETDGLSDDDLQAAISGGPRRQGGG